MPLPLHPQAPVIETGPMVSSVDTLARVLDVRLEGLDYKLHVMSRDLTAQVNASAKAHAQLGKDVRSVNQAVMDLASEARTMREESRIRDERVAVAADTLATETERRRSELADTITSTDRKFTRREKQIGWALTVGVPSAVLLLTQHPLF